MNVRTFIEHCTDQDTDEFPANTECIIIVEVPHQTRAKVIYYEDESDYEEQYIASVLCNDSRGDVSRLISEGADAAGAAEEHAAQDLHAWAKLTGLDDILDYTPPVHRQPQVLAGIASLLEICL